MTTIAIMMHDGLWVISVIITIMMMMMMMMMMLLLKQWAVFMRVGRSLGQRLHWKTPTWLVWLNHSCHRHHHQLRRRHHRCNHDQHHHHHQPLHKSDPKQKQTFFCLNWCQMKEVLSWFWPLRSEIWLGLGVCNNANCKPAKSSRSFIEADCARVVCQSEPDLSHKQLQPGREGWNISNMLALHNHMPTYWSQSSAVSDWTSSECNYCVFQIPHYHPMKRHAIQWIAN